MRNEILDMKKGIKARLESDSGAAGDYIPAGGLARLSCGYRQDVWPRRVSRGGERAELRGGVRGHAPGGRREEARGLRRAGRLYRVGRRYERGGGD